MSGLAPPSRRQPCIVTVPLLLILGLSTCCRPGPTPVGVMGEVDLGPASAEHAWSGLSMLAGAPGCTTREGCDGDRSVPLSAEQVLACRQRRAVYWRQLAAEVTRHSIRGLTMTNGNYLTADCHHGLYTGVTDADLVHLAGLHRLEHLDLSYTPVTRLDALRGLGGLRRLDLRQTPLTDLAAIGSFSGLRELSLVSDARRSSLSYAPLAHLQRLEVLNVEGAGVSDGDLAHLAGLRALRRLGLRFNHVHGPGLRHLRDLPRLAALDLVANPVADEALSLLPTTLQSLKLPAVDPQALARLAALRQLRTLSIPRGFFVNAVPAPGGGWYARGLSGLASLRHLARLPKLVALALNDSDLPDELTEHLVVLGRLEELKLGRNALTAAGVARLGALRQLVDLDLSEQCVSPREGAGGDEPTTQPRRGLTDEVLPSLAPLRQLRHLRLRGCGGRQGFSQLRGLPRLERLVHLDLSENPLQGEAVARIVAAAPHLTSLDLSATDLTDAQLAQVAQLRQLERLILDGNDRLTMRGIRRLAPLRRLRELGARIEYCFSKADLVEVGRLWPEGTVHRRCWSP